ncbi:MAG: hypothetical protein HY465_04650 [Deltaproteobacteria bacterium]|nr:hypothetical protein [Deltaproteobacteria bacterium]
MAIAAPQFQSLIRPAEGESHFLNLARGTETVKPPARAFEIAKRDPLATLVAGGAEAPPPPASMPGVSRFTVNSKTK